MTCRDFLYASTALVAASAPRRDPPTPAIDTHVHFYDPSRPQGVPWPAKTDSLLHRHLRKSGRGKILLEKLARRLPMAATGRRRGTRLMSFQPLVAVLVLGLLVLACLRAETTPAVPPPAGSSTVIRDTCANHWTLAPAAAGGRRLLVLPAQSSHTWIEANIPGIADGNWTRLAVGDDGDVIVENENTALRFNPAHEQPLAQASPLATAAPAVPITSWRTVARMPSGNHDLSAAVLDGQVYIAGGFTAHWGFPAQPHAFDNLWHLDPASWSWRTAVKLNRPRVYCGTVSFGGKIWIVGGDVVDADGVRRASASIEIFDPETGTLVAGPELPVAHAAPLALFARGRLYVMGASDRKAAGRVDSIGTGETSWHREPDGPAQMIALAGAALYDRLYVCVPQTGLAVFDPALGTWSTIPGPTQPRSPQVAAWSGELWIMGGRDIADQSETRIYNPITRRWRTGPPLPRELAWGAAAAVGDRLIVAGGWTKGHFGDLTLALHATAAPLPPPSGPRASEVFLLPAWDGSSLQGTANGHLAATTSEAFPHLKLRRPVVLLSVPEKDPAAPERWLVVEVDGAVSTFPNRADVRPSELQVVLNVPARTRRPTQTYSLAFHPRFPASPYLYVVYNRSQPKPAENTLARFTIVSLDPLRADPESEEVLLRWPSDGHNGADVKFGPEGFLYVSTGDGSPPGDPKNLGQRVDRMTGGVLRLDVDRRDAGKNYAVPPDNPFVGLANVLPEYWAYGLRNPWRMSFAPTGELWLGDNGDDSWESIHLIRKGHNYGWSVFEGSHPFKRTLTLAGPTPRATTPIVELSHAEARSVIGGRVYRGGALRELAGHYLFGDYVTGFVWAFKWDGHAPQNLRRIADTRARPLAFAEERSGEILILRLDGQIHRLIPGPPQNETPVPFPRLLSETGLFASTKDHRPAAGVIPYEINAGLWSDGAVARRLLALPAQARIGFAEHPKTWKIPDGSALVRTLELPAPTGPVRVETQVMHRENGIVHFYTYAWNAAQTDAELVAAAGETRAVPGVKDRHWHFSRRAECTICHTAQTDFVLGLATAQLNRDADYSALDGGIANQIAALSRGGIFDRPPAQPPGQLPRKVRPDDLTATLEARARSYLSVNCAHCHRTDGVGGRAEFQLLDSLPLARTGIVNGQPLVPLLGPAARLVTPGAPQLSELFHRMNMQDGGRMPLLGSQQRDDDGVQLIREWIEKMRAPEERAAK